MKPTLSTASAIAAAAIAVTLLGVGCGGGGDSENSADSQEITRLVGELNRITAQKDASGFCDVMQPSGVEANFNTHSRCVEETALILKQAGEQPTLNIADIKVDGDQATVDLEGTVGELSLVKENDRWYIAFSDLGTGSQSSDSSAGGQPSDSGSEGG